MKTQHKVITQFAICINNTHYPASLELHKVYRIIPDITSSEEGDIRVIDESGEDYLYPLEYFIPLELPKEVEKILLQ